MPSKAPLPNLLRRHATHQGTLLRYTSFASAVHLLMTRKITLVDPSRWDDQNDAYYLKVYKDKSNLQSVLALCFAVQSETYHHWRVFAPGADGICIEFDAEPLKGMFSAVEGVTMRGVDYYELKHLTNRDVKISELPFLKRYPYEPEQEFRVVYSDPIIASGYKDLDIDLSWIKKITLSPWLPEAFIASVANALTHLPGCKFLNVARTTLLSNSTWQAIADRSVNG